MELGGAQDGGRPLNEKPVDATAAPQYLVPILGARHKLVGLKGNPVTAVKAHSGAAPQR